MADNSPPAGLLDRADEVFSIAQQLGIAFQDARDSDHSTRQNEPAGWSRQKQLFDKFCSAILELQPKMEKPSQGFANVASALTKAARVAKSIRDALQIANGRDWAGCLDFVPELNSVATAGQDIVASLKQSWQLNPFAFVECLDSEAVDVNSEQSKSVIARLIVGPDEAILSPREYAIVNAYLKQKRSMATEQREVHQLRYSPTQRKREKLLRIWNFNLGLLKLGQESVLANDARAPSGPASKGALPAESKTAPTESLDKADDERRQPAKPNRRQPARKKRSTRRGEGREKLVSALTKHHQYADGSCLNLEPIGNNVLADVADVSTSTASAFFDEQFKGHDKYKVLCRDSGRLAAALKLLNNEFAPHDLYGRQPPDEDDRDDKGDD